MPTVTAHDYPHGLRCMTCGQELPPGSAYVEADIAPDWTTPICVNCPEPTQEDG